MNKTNVFLALLLWAMPTINAAACDANSYASLQSCFTSKGTVNINLTATITLTGSIVMEDNTTYNITTNGYDIILNGQSFTGGNVGNTLIIINGIFTIRNHSGSGFIIADLNASSSLLAFLGIILPIELNDFKIVQKGSYHLLTWTTLSEKRGDKFDIESSTNGTDFTKIGTVKAKGTTSSYSFLNSNSAYEKTIYYRLMMIDIDGSAAYSKVVSINDNKLTGKIKVYPNPVTEGYLNVETGADVQNILITNTLGQVVLNAKESKINVSQLAKGLYNVTIQANNETLSERFFKN